MTACEILFLYIIKIGATMTILESIATKAAIDILVNKGGLSNVFNVANMGDVEKVYQKCLNARNKKSALWSLATQIETHINDIKTKQITLRKNLAIRIATGDTNGLDYDTHRKNAAVILSILYTHLREDGHLEDTLKNFDWSPEKEYKMGALEKAAAGAAGASVLIIGIPQWAFLARRSIAALNGESFLPKPAPEVVNYKEFHRKMRGHLKP